jgi:hypothetical protein
MTVLVCLVLALAAMPASAGTSKLKPSPAQVVYPTATAESPAFRDLPVVTPEECQGEPREVENFFVPKAKAQPYTPGEIHEDTALQSRMGSAPMPSPLISFEGINNIYGVYPPDTEGDIGPDHYVQWVNLGIQGWSINRSAWSATTAFGPVNGNTIWTPLGGPCSTQNDGDPIVLWDRFRQRWVISQFAVDSTPYRVAIAVSKTSDPSGQWWLYCFDYDATNFNDYPKFGVWPDGYYMTVNQFAGGSSWAGAGVCVFEADKMITGDPTARMLKVNLGAVSLNYGGILPAHFEGMNNPPGGSPGYFVEVDDSSWFNPPLANDTISLWKAHVNWTAGTFTVGSGGNPDLQFAVANFTPLPCVGVTRNCIPQPGTTQKLDSLGDRAMYRLQYRNYGSYESMVFNHTVLADVSGDRAGIRWYELRKDSGHPDWYLYQQGTYGPADGIYRWMGSAAQDHVGNLAVGYSLSDGTSTYPSIGYAGRLAGDPLGTLPQSEIILQAGGGYQSGSGARWGDYSSMSVDPVDDCTFWYTQEYIQTSGTTPWRTRIGAFKFASCTVGPTGTLTGTVSALAGGTPIVGATVSAFDGVNTIQTLSGAGGVYTMSLPVNTYSVTASAYGYNPQTVNGVAITNGGTTTQNFSLTSAASHTIYGTVTDAGTGWPLYATITVTGDGGYPGATIYTNPADGYYSITLVDGNTYGFTVTPWVSGYTPGTASVGPLAGDVTQDFALAADMAACTAPGYTQPTPLNESFTATTTPAGWSVVNNGGDCVWRFDNPNSRANNTGGSGNFAIADSDYCGSGSHMDTELRTPVINATGMAVVTLQFKYDYYNLGDTGDVDVSVNGASGPWTHVWHKTASDRGPKTATIDISSIAANQPNVMIRFHYYNAYWAWWWEVDDVKVTAACVAPASGGLIYGNVYDANTLAPLAGATVSNATTGGTAVTAATPDPNVDDAFYCMYGAEGANTMSATKTLYGPDNQSATVPHYGVVQRDFHLATGQLAASPASLSWATVPGGTGGTTLTLSNIGGADVNWTVHELSGHVARPTGNLFTFNLRPHPAKGEMLTRAFLEERAEEAAREERRDSKSEKEAVEAKAGKRIVLSLDKDKDEKAPVKDLPAMPFGLSGRSADRRTSPSPYDAWPPSGPVQLYVDDGIPEDSIGLGSGGQFVWFNRFTPNPADFPFLLDQISVIFNTTVSVGSNMELLVYEDPDGDPNNGATFLYSQNVTVLHNDFSTWNNYTLTTPVLCAGPGDVLVGLVNRDGLADYPAAIDETASQGRSWIGYYGGPAPDPPTFPASSLWGTIDSFGFAGNWTVRASGHPADIPWLDENPKTGTVTAGGSTDVDVTYDATGLAPGIYEATLSFANDTPYGPLNVPVTLTVAEPPVVPVATAVPVNGLAPLTVAFTGTATGGIGTYSYDWNFGDGSPHSSAQNPSHTYNIGGSFTVTLTVTASVMGSGVDNHLVIAVTPPAIPVVNNFTDDAPRNLEQACFNRLTGAYVWTVLSGPHVGTVFTGTAAVYNAGAKFTNKPADPNKFSVVYDPVKHKASGWLISGGVYYPLTDSNTTNNPPGCY